MNQQQLYNFVYLEGYYRCYRRILFPEKGQNGPKDNFYCLDCQDQALESFQEIILKRRNHEMYLEEFQGPFRRGWETACRQVEWEGALGQAEGLN